MKDYDQNLKTITQYEIKQKPVGLFNQGWEECTILQMTFFVLSRHIYNGPYLQPVMTISCWKAGRAVGATPSPKQANSGVDGHMCAPPMHIRFYKFEKHPYKLFFQCILDRGNVALFTLWWQLGCWPNVAITHWQRSHAVGNTSSESHVQNSSNYEHISVKANICSVNSAANVLGITPWKRAVSYLLWLLLNFLFRNFLCLW